MSLTWKQGPSGLGALFSSTGVVAPRQLFDMALQGFRIQMKLACYRESVSQSSTRRGKQEKGSARGGRDRTARSWAGITERQKQTVLKREGRQEVNKTPGHKQRTRSPARYMRQQVPDHRGQTLPCVTVLL